MAAVRRGNTLAVPEQFVIGAAQPGVFTSNGQGFGQGVILRSGSQTLADPGSPAERGEEVTIYCTGLGEVDPAVEPGAAAPDPPPLVVAQVQVRIGDLPAEVQRASLSPGFAGRYEVRVVVPPNAPAGDSVSVVVTAAGRSSAPVTMAIR